MAFGTRPESKLADAICDRYPTAVIIYIEPNCYKNDFSLTDISALFIINK
jgi:hypothetical protein